MKKEEVASIIDHTILKPEVDYHYLEAVCFEAVKYSFATVAIHPSNIRLVKKWLEGSNVGVTAALAFPFGSWSAEMKVFEVQDAIKKGATDCDFVINIGALKDKKYDVIKKEMELIRKACKNKIAKSIIEVGFLNEYEIVKACELGANAGMDFVKTSTGFFDKPTPAIAKIMFETLKNTSTRVKVAGGIKNADDAKKMIDAGAKRLGTSSGVEIIQGWKE
ncbi:MAG: deoxyribose-phosphate aldolase [Actinobacteria bacterium]|nr:deoxyribose-phosphate aldolase [Actinomycetota bacterium]